VAAIFHNPAHNLATIWAYGMSCWSPVRRAAIFALVCGSALTMPIGSAATHIAAASKNSLPPISKDARKLPIDVASSQVDYKGDTVLFKDVVITQGDTRVQADRAHAVGLENFDNSRWTFEGNVRINGEQHGSLRSDQAVVEFRNKNIAKATAIGNPAEFEQKRSDSDETARGHAREIVYNVNDGTVRLSNDAWLSDRHNEISGQELIYSIREQRVQAEAQPGSDGRVHIKIVPQPNESPNKKP
jgi:lipopolysaccharide transport protein LptA